MSNSLTTSSIKANFKSKSSNINPLSGSLIFSAPQLTNTTSSTISNALNS